MKLNLKKNVPICPVCHGELEPQEWEEPVVSMDCSEYEVKVWTRCHHCQADYTIIEHYAYIGHEAPVKA